MLLKIKKYKRLIIFSAVVIAVLGLILRYGSVEAQNSNYDMGGWFWTDNYGWISLNSGNAELVGDSTNLVPYKVIVAGNALSGWGWSSNAGWVCFGETCDSSHICDLALAGSCSFSSFGTAVPAGGWHVSINATTHKLEGWAKIISLKDNGWIHLGMSAEVVANNQPGAQCYDCQTTSSPPVIIGCNSCFTRTKFDNVNIPDPAVDSVVGGSGNICFGCTACNKIMSDDGINSRVSCSACNDCHLYGGASDSSTGGSLGWGWNGNNDGADKLSHDGAGWVEFSPSGGESGLVYPWLQTQYGTIFSSNNFRQKSVVSSINATYCIFAQDALNFHSQTCAKNIPDINISFPQKNAVDSSYKNALGRLDVVGLSTIVKVSTSGKKINKYGNIINELAGNQTWNQPITLNGQVYVINGDLTLDSGFVILNGENNLTGNGLVIVNGDLNVDNDFSYDSGIVSQSDLKKLASVAWVAKGDIIIKPDVEKAVGAFIALGQDNAVCLYSDNTACSAKVEYPDFKQNGYGIFFSGVSANPLVVSGLLMAKGFNLGRTYSNIRQGSEEIIYDGRLSANPPPGLQSLMEILPIIRDFQY